jgi:hypothetical protein
MVILPPGMENYHPDVVRLRMQGGAGRELVSGYTGRTATRTEGFDPTAVPTLVDRAEQRVHVDAVEICEHLDRRGRAGRSLSPRACAATSTGRSPSPMACHCRR